MLTQEKIDSIIRASRAANDSSIQFVMRVEAAVIESCAFVCSCTPKGKDCRYSVEAAAALRAKGREVEMILHRQSRVTPPAK